MSKLDQVVFAVVDGEIIESTIRNLGGYIEETTTPHGVGPVYHVREYPKFTVDGEDFSSREDAQAFAEDNDLAEEIVEGTSYELWRWVASGNYPRKIQAFDTEAEANEALDETFYIDFCSSDKFFCTYSTREEAEKFLSEITE